MDVRFADGQSMSLVSDDAWRASSSSAPGWDAPAFDDAAWSKAKSVARYGQGPWGNIDAPRNHEFLGPQSTGIPGVVRIIYVPDAAAIEVNRLDKNARYSARFFDPVTGQTKQAPRATSDKDGRWRCPAPAGQDHDWVVILEGTKAILRGTDASPVERSGG
jgi:hypothetical protein